MKWLLSVICVSSLLMAQFASACPALLDHRFTSLQGKKVNLCEFANRPILIVNTASKCGYTPQFEKLEALHKQYARHGLVVLGFPSNDFNQELASNHEIAQFCLLTYAIEFPMIEQGAVTGAKASPLYRALAAASGEAPQWNFHKYLIAPDGKTVHGFRSAVEPDAPEIKVRIQAMLKSRPVRQ
ncbi:MAG: glutathione peroxidase [Burkholderiales bacterium]